MMKTFICSGCGFAVSIDEGVIMPACPACGGELVNTGVDGDTYMMMNALERTELKKKFCASVDKCPADERKKQDGSVQKPHEAVEARKEENCKSTKEPYGQETGEGGEDEGEKRENSLEASIPREDADKCAKTDREKEEKRERTARERDEKARKARAVAEERERTACEKEEKALTNAAGQIYDVDMDAIDPKVAAYLKKTAREKLNREKEYRNSVLQSCGFTHPERKEVTDSDNYDKTETDAAGVTHYYATSQVTDDVTPEEFDLILKASGRSKNPEDSKVSSGAARFFTVVTVILWLFGLITSIMLAEAASSSVGFETFMNAFLPFFFYGCLTMCAAELFRRLAKIQSILTSIKNKLNREE